MRLTLVFLSFFMAPAVAAPPWVVNYVPVGAPDSAGRAWAVAVDASGNIFVAATGEFFGQSQMCVFKLNPQGSQLGQGCFGYAPVNVAQSYVAAAAVDPQGNHVIAGRL